MVQGLGFRWVPKYDDHPQTDARSGIGLCSIGLRVLGLRATEGLGWLSTLPLASCPRFGRYADSGSGSYSSLRSSVPWFRV